MAADALALLEHLDFPPSAATAVGVLSEPVRLWMDRDVGAPTPAQCLAWPAIAARKNLLLCAPTGSGKTLAGFLPILGELLTGPLTPGVRCLYLAPLKALGNDVRKNLAAALDGLRPFLPEGCGNICVALRTGDTPARTRRQQRFEPPEVLLTTPESLAVLLSQEWAGDFFAPLRWVVVDEVHALAAGKRGCDLSLSLERLTDLVSGELQRIGLSATCTPAPEAAQFLVGVGRACAVAQVPDTRALQLAVEPLPEGPTFLAGLVDRLERELSAYESTLIFAQTRSLAERLAWLLRRRFPQWIEEIAVHHSALAARRRRVVERGLKRGELRAVVSSTSLELGIDIGSVENVVLVHPPGDVVRLLQRVGRSGHGPGRLRRGLVLASGAGELFEAAVTAASGRSAQCEPLRVPEHPLDVLCQQLAGMAAARPWTADEAYALARRAYPYRDLSRDDFDAAIDYLSGRRADGREWLPLRLAWHGDTFRIADARTARLLRRNLGTILSEEPRPVRRTSGRAVGEVEEAFAERLQPGDRFLLDGRCWEYRREEGRALLVQEVVGRPAVPRWTAEGLPMSAELAQRLYLLRVQAAEALRQGRQGLVELLRTDYPLDDAAVALLAAHFERQEAMSEIPDLQTLLIEVITRDGAAEYYLHTPLHRAGNDALVRVAVRRLVRGDGRRAHALVTDLGLVLAVAGKELVAEDFRRLLSVQGFEADLSAALAESEALRQRFQRVAMTGLMLLRNPLGGRRRVGGSDWGERRLFDQVRSAEPGFVLLRQAERELRREVCDVAAAGRYLEGLPRRMVRCRRLAQISPFVESWGPVDPGPAEAVETPGEALQRLHASLMGTGPV